MSLGLVQWVPHLVESDAPGAQIVHPVGLRWPTEKTLENELGQDAHAAASTMLTDGQRGWAADEGLWLVPVPAHMANVHLVGIARLTYRPHTSVTAAWYAELQEKGGEYLRRYRELLAQPRPAACSA